MDSTKQGLKNLKIEIHLSTHNLVATIDFVHRSKTFTTFVHYKTSFILPQYVVNLKRFNKVFGTPINFLNELPKENPA